jgi:hypothetical protein
MVAEKPETGWKCSESNISVLSLIFHVSISQSLAFHLDRVVVFRFYWHLGDKPEKEKNIKLGKYAKILTVQFSVPDP